MNSILSAIESAVFFASSQEGLTQAIHRGSNAFFEKKHVNAYINCLTRNG